MTARQWGDCRGFWRFVCRAMRGVKTAGARTSVATAVRDSNGHLRRKPREVIKVRQSYFCNLSAAQEERAYISDNALVEAPHGRCACCPPCTCDSAPVPATAAREQQRLCPAYGATSGGEWPSLLSGPVALSAHTWRRLVRSGAHCVFEERMAARVAQCEPEAARQVRPISAVMRQSPQGASTRPS